MGISRSFFDVIVRVAREGGLELHLLLDAVETRGDQCREGQVGIEVGAADAAFDADGLGTGAAHPIARRAVVEAPDGARRREGARHEALVGIDVGREEVGDLAGVLQLAGQVLSHRRRHAVVGGLIEEEGRLPVPGPQRLVNMAGAPGQIVVPLGHEVIALPRPWAISLAPFLMMACRSAISSASAYRTLISSWPGPHSPLEFSTRSRPLQAVAEGPHDDPPLGRLQDVVVLDVVPVCPPEVAVAFAVRALVAVVEEEELELGRHIGLEVHGLEAPKLLPEDRSRGVGHVLMAVVIHHVADHQRGAGEPRGCAAGSRGRA